MGWVARDVAWDADDREPITPNNSHDIPGLRLAPGHCAIHGRFDATVLQVLPC